MRIRSDWRGRSTLSEAAESVGHCALGTAILIMICGSECVDRAMPLYYKSKAVYKRARRRCHCRITRLRSKPILPLDRKDVWSRGPRGEGGGTTTTPKMSFLHLPLEIRHMIYDFLLGEPGIIEPQGDYGYVLWDTRPKSWKVTHRHIRSDSDPPSKPLAAMVMHPEGRWHRSPRHIAHYAPRYPLVCGVGELLPMPSAQGPNYLNLMRTCRVVYSELLERLYGANTISLCGADMVDVVAREWSLEGLARVGYVHVALVVNTEKGWKSDLAWDRRKWRRELEQTMHTLVGAFPAMRQLDLEIAVPGEELYRKSHREALWADLCEVLEGYLTPSPTTETADRKRWRLKKRPRPRPQLEEFVLKVPLCTWVGNAQTGESGCGSRPLSSWNENDYQRLKAVICGKETTQSVKEAC